MGNHRQGPAVPPTGNQRQVLAATDGELGTGRASVDQGTEGNSVVLMYCCGQKFTKVCREHHGSLEFQ